MNLEDWNTVVIDRALVDLHEVVPPRKHFPKSQNVDSRVRLMQRLLELVAITWRGPIEIHFRVAFISVATKEILGLSPALVVAEARHVESDRTMRTGQRWLGVEDGHLAAAAAAAHVRRKIVSQDAARVAQPARMLRAGGIQQNAYRLLRLGAQDHHAGINFARLESIAINVRNAAGDVALRIHQDCVRHGVRN